MSIEKGASGGLVFHLRILNRKLYLHTKRMSLPSKLPAER